jgi:ABC-type nitrate/sulfonate/bicarbonate transport system substrate-binding protein
MGKAALGAVYAVVCAVSFCAMNAPVARADDAPKLVRFGWQAATPVTTFWAGFELGTFAQQGLKLEPTSFTDKDGNHWSAVNLIARKDANVASLKDLVGKRVAVFGLSSNWYLALCDRLRELNIDPKSIRFLSMPYPQMEGALAHNEVDAAVMTSIGAFHASQRVPVNFLMSSDEITKIPIDMSQVIVARADWLKDHEDEAVRFLMGMLTTRKYIEDDVAKGGDAIKAITRKTLKLDPETNEAFYKLRVASAGRELALLNSLDLPKQTFVTYGKMLVDAGQLRGKPAATFEQAIDTSYLRKAFARLGMTWDDTKVAGQ